MSFVKKSSIYSQYSGSLKKPKLVYHRRGTGSGLDEDGILYVSTGDVLITHKSIDSDYVDYLGRLGWDTKNVTFLTIDGNTNLENECLRVKKQIKNKHLAYLDTFDCDQDAITVSNTLGLPLNGNPEISQRYASKSSFRSLAKKRNIPIPEGFEQLHSYRAINRSVLDLFKKYQQVVLKINEGEGGYGQLVLQKQSYLMLSKHQKLQQLHAFLSYNQRYNTHSGVVVEQFIPNLTASIGVHALIKPSFEYEFYAMHEVINKNLTVGIGHKYPCSNLSKKVSVSLHRDLMQFSKYLADKKYIGYWAFDAILKNDTYFYTEISLRKMGGTRPHLIRKKLFGDQNVYFVSERVEDEVFQGKSFGELEELFSDLLIKKSGDFGVFIYNIANLSRSGKFLYICFAENEAEAQRYCDLVKQRIALYKRKKLYKIYGFLKPFLIN